jgi:hypothetical protein
MKQVPILKAKKIESKLRIPSGPMETKTVNNIQFMAPELKPTVLARDMHPGSLTVPKGIFNTKSTNSDTYLGLKGERSILFKPDLNNLDITGERHLDTDYKQTFVDHGLTMCESKAYLIAKAIHNKRLEEQLKNNNNNNQIQANVI